MALLWQAFTVLLLTTTSPLLAATRHVPAQYATIQAAVDAAVDGDCIEVAPGLYVESLAFLGKDIHVRSVSGPAVTTIRGSGSSVVEFVSGETNEAILEGFSITGGEASVGAGIFVTQSNPTIRGNWIFGNPPIGSSTQGGGGIGVFDADAVMIEHNLIVDNLATFGGGIYANSSTLVLRQNIIARNMGRESGGGLFVTTGQMTVDDCLVVQNDVEDAPFGGGGVFVENASISIHGSTIADNTVNGGFIPGVYVEFNSVADVQNCVLWGNRSEVPGGSISEMQLFVSVAATGSVSFTNVEGGPIGSDGLSEDPRFRPGPGLPSPLFSELLDYYLEHTETGDPATSPCVDAGNPATPLPIGSTRADGLPDIGDVDLGFHYVVDLFRRGDVNNDDAIDVTDAIASLDALFVPGSSPVSCLDSADINDDGFHDISDPLFLLSALFVAGAPDLPDPTFACGADPTTDDLACDQSGCP